MASLELRTAPPPLPRGRPRPLFTEVGTIFICHIPFYTGRLSVPFRVWKVYGPTALSFLVRFVEVVVCLKLWLSRDGFGRSFTQVMTLDFRIVEVAVSCNPPNG
jgi:hypothetical protein